MVWLHIPIDITTLKHANTVKQCRGLHNDKQPPSSLPLQIHNLEIPGSRSQGLAELYPGFEIHSGYVGFRYLENRDEYLP